MGRYWTYMKVGLSRIIPERNLTPIKVKEQASSLGGSIPPPIHQVL